MIKKTLLSLLAAVALTVPAIQAQDPQDLSQRDEEREAYNAARRTNTIDGWEIFIHNYPESFYIEQARKMRDNAIVRDYCNRQITLDRLVNYIEDNETHEPRIKTFYANLVNNPTHSYRYEHMDIGFNGCTGRVDETITLADGSPVRHNYFIFDERGLLVKSSITGSRGKAVVTTYDYDYDNLHGYCLKSVKRGGRTYKYDVFFNENDKLELITGDDNHKWVFSYGENGALNKLVVADASSKRTLVYRDGYIIRCEIGSTAQRYLYDYDSATFKKYLIGIVNQSSPDSTQGRTIEYQIDTKGRITWAKISNSQKEYMTIERTYSK